MMGKTALHPYILPYFRKILNSFFEFSDKFTISIKFPYEANLFPSNSWCKPTQQPAFSVCKEAKPIQTLIFGVHRPITNTFCRETASAQPP